MIILDTHAFLWFLNDSEELPENTKQFICSQEKVAVSIASFWEIAIKQSLNKLKIDCSLSDLENSCYENDIFVLPITVKNLDLLKSLPKIHGDPFDRLIICQTLTENASLVTRDSLIPKYKVKTLWNL